MVSRWAKEAVNSAARTFFWTQLAKVVGRCEPERVVLAWTNVPEDAQVAMARGAGASDALRLVAGWRREE